jgi:hypothetical protein
VHQLPLGLASGVGLHRAHAKLAQHRFRTHSFHRLQKAHIRLPRRHGLQIPVPVVAQAEPRGNLFRSSSSSGAASSRSATAATSEQRALVWRSSQHESERGSGYLTGGKEWLQSDAGMQTGGQGGYQYRTVAGLGGMKGVVELCNHELAHRALHRSTAGLWQSTRSQQRHGPWNHALRKTSRNRTGNWPRERARQPGP